MSLIRMSAIHNTQWEAKAQGIIGTKGPTVFIMPFGKHKGKPLQQVPTGYLEWLQSLSDLSPSLRGAINLTLIGEVAFGPTPDEKVDQAKARQTQIMRSRGVSNG